jgi:uncharacterized membrane protein (DUF2068 family)
MSQVARGAQQAGRSETARKVVLFGWAAKGVVYVTLAYLVLQMAFGAAPQQPTTTGALQYIAQTAPGKIALIVLGVGLLAFAVGRILEVTTLAGPQIEGKDKLIAVVLAVLYASLAFTAFTIVGLAGSGSSGSGSGGSQQQGSAFLLGLPGGRWIVGLVGLAVIAFGALEAYKGVQQKFLPTLRSGEMSPGVRSATTRLGTAAYVTKGAILALLGYFFLQSALTYDPDRAKGLDAALQEIAGKTWGQVVLTLVALGLLAYGVFALIESRYRRVGSSASGTA